jgi:hypothetical protein
MAVRHAVRWPSTRCRPLGLPTDRPLVPSAGGRPTRTFVRTLGRLDASGRRPSDVIFPKDVRCDNPAYRVQTTLNLRTYDVMSSVGLCFVLINADNACCCHVSSRYWFRNAASNCAYVVKVLALCDLYHE